MKISHRLSKIDSMITQSYARIWDCCCDHGLLGMTLLERKASEQVYFVDIVAKQMSALTEKLERFFPNNSYNWKVICEDLRELVVVPSQSQLFVIAGVGGDKTTEFIESLVASNKGMSFDLLTCSVHGNYQVRGALIKAGYRLFNEEIIVENNRYYEIVYASKKAVNNIELTGSLMWDWSNPVHLEYWRKSVGHFRKKLLADPAKFGPIAEAYERIKPSDELRLK
jgi:tRNA (adenine22-N1)-methyltransferase